MKWISLFVLCFHFCANASSETCEGGVPQTGNFSYFEEWISTKYRVTIKDAQFAMAHPFVTKRANEFFNAASAMALELCYPTDPKQGFKTSKTAAYDDQVDAIRHVIGSTLMYYYYPNYALQALSGHEINGKTALDAGNLMDLTNNQQGRIVALKIQAESEANRKKLSPYEVSMLAAKEALLLLGRGQLKVINPQTDNKCAEAEALVLKNKGKRAEHIFNNYKKRLDHLAEMCSVVLYRAQTDCGKIILSD